MLEDLTLATFTPRVGETFEIDAGDGTTVPLTLIEARPTAAEGDTRRLREPFALLFRGPKAPIYEQQIIPLRNDALGTLHLFLVPLAPDAQGSLYEAVFG